MNFEEFYALLLPNEAKVMQEYIPRWFACRRVDSQYIVGNSAARTAAMDALLEECKDGKVKTLESLLAELKRIGTLDSDRVKSSPAESATTERMNGQSQRCQSYDSA